jgi:hypothetical protein
MGRRFDSESEEAMDEQEVEAADDLSRHLPSGKGSTTSSMSSCDPLMDISSDRGRRRRLLSSSDWLLLRGTGSAS